MTDIGPGTHVQVYRGQLDYASIGSVWLVLKAWEDVLNWGSCEECPPDEPSTMCLELMGQPPSPPGYPANAPICGCCFRPYQGPEQEKRVAGKKVGELA